MEHWQVADHQHPRKSESCLSFTSRLKSIISTLSGPVLASQLSMFLHQAYRINMPSVPRTVFLMALGWSSGLVAIKALETLERLEMSQRMGRY